MYYFRHLDTLQACKYENMSGNQTNFSLPPAYLYCITTSYGRDQKAGCAVTLHSQIPNCSENEKLYLS